MNTQLWINMLGCCVAAFVGTQLGHMLAYHRFKMTTEKRSTE